MTTLEMIDNALRYGVYNKSQLIDCKAEIERLGHSLVWAIVEVERREKEQAELEKKLDTARMELQRLQETVNEFDATSIEQVLKETL